MSRPVSGRTRAISPEFEFRAGSLPSRRGRWHTLVTDQVGHLQDARQRLATDLAFDYARVYTYGIAQLALALALIMVNADVKTLPGPLSTGPVLVARGSPLYEHDLLVPVTSANRS